MNRHLCTVLLLAFLLSAAPSRAQNHVTLGGTVFGDYYYVLEAPESDPDEEDLNGFTIRRAYLTADFELSRGFSGRARLEANRGNVSGRGMDAFVKDLYLRWRSERGHAIRLGIIPIPHWEDSSEPVWDYRSLEATVMDLFGVASSRDMGVRVDGPLLAGDRLNYALMAGNGNGQLPETDRGKRVYAALTSRPVGDLVIGVSADYAGHAGDQRGITAHAFAGYDGDRFKLGVEPFWNRLDLVADEAMTTSGVSLFAHAGITERWRVVGRIDFAESTGDTVDPGATFGLVAISYEPIPNVRLMPNLWILKQEGADSGEVLGRFTFEYSF